ncbi:hypothetical protein HOF78_01805 [Candidatus Woesearchaeota archaeon]|jgi:hypothetical protein|nr:hypothetical protein [Candidatus Woesearchaeota archaeon]
MPKKRNFLKDILYAVGFGLLIIYVLFLFGGPYESDIIGVDNIYEVVEDKNVLIDTNDCKLPKEKIGVMCCIRDDEMPNICADEADVFFHKIEMTEEISENNIIYLEDIMSFQEPPGYYIVKDVKFGGLGVPYYYLATDDAGYESVSIWIVDAEELFGEYSVRDGIQEFQEGLDKGFDMIEEVAGVKILERENRIIKTSNGYEAVVNELKYYLDGDIYYTKNVVFLDKPLLLSFEATTELVDYVYEFDDLLNSITFY